MNHVDATLNPTDAQLEKRARRNVGRRMGFFIHAFVFLAVNLGLYLINHVVGGRPWHVFPLAGWGLALAIHGAVVALALGTGEWRERMLQGEIERLRRIQR